MNPVRRVALGIEYDGSPFHGWQRQTALTTVQGVLENALAQISGELVGVIAAGRTDTGVHALAQVAHFDTSVERPLQAWVRGVNRYLPPAVGVHWAVEVDSEFHARFSAISRRYRYVLFNNPVRPALNNSRVGWFHLPLDVAAISHAAKYLLGEHDFTSFRSSECQAKSPVKTMHQLQVTAHGDYVMFDFHAGGFLHHMVRNIVGALIWVGQGKQSPEWLATLLAARNRAIAAPTFSPDGLYFVGAEYDARWRLPQTARIMLPFDPSNTDQ